MRILAIRGCNLASLAGEFEIDLANGALGGAGVFAIVGPTGAGKSTLLDAMCVALFDRTPRLTNHSRVIVGRGDDDPTAIGAQDVRTLLRRGASAGWAEVDFESGDSRRYRARWSVRRARGATDGRFQNQQVTLSAIDRSGLLAEPLGGTKTETLEAIHQRLGLTFDQFRRSALLAQGEFAAFLRADGKDRSELLERMTGTEIYSQLSIAAHVKATLAGHDLRERQGAALAIAVLSPEARAQAEAELAIARQAQAATRARLAGAESAARWLAEAKSRQRALVEAETTHSAAEQAVDAAKILRAELALRRRAEAMRPAWDDAAKLDRQLAIVQGELASASEAVIRAESGQRDVAARRARIVELHTPIRDARLGAGLRIAESVSAAPPASGSRRRKSAATDSVASVDAPSAAADPSSLHAVFGPDLEARASTAVAHDAAWLSARSSLVDGVAGWRALDANLAQHTVLAAEIVAADRALEEHARRRDLLGRQRTGAASEHQQAQAKLAEAQREADAFQKRRGLTLDAARRQEDEARKRSGDFEKLLGVTGEARGAATARAELERQLGELATAAGADKKARRAAGGERDTAATLRAERARVVDELRKAAGYEHARTELVDGEPCALCGATEHPWRDRGSFDALIVDAQAKLAEATARGERALASLAALDARDHHRVAERQRLTACLATAETSATAAQVRWREQLASLGELLLVDDPANDAAQKLADERIVSARSKLDAARTARHQAEAVAKAGAEAQALVQTRHNDVEQHARALRDLDAALASIEAAVARVRGERAGKVEREVELLVAVEAALARWDAGALSPSEQRAIEQARSVIAPVAAKRRSSTSTTPSTSSGVVEERRDSAKSERLLVPDAVAILERCRRALGDLVEAWTMHAEVVVELDGALAAALVQIDEVAREIEHAVTEHATRRDASTARRDAVRDELAVAADRLDAARVAAGFERPELQRLLADDPSKLDALGEQLDGLDRALDRARTLVAERRRLVDLHASQRPSIESAPAGTGDPMPADLDADPLAEEARRVPELATAVSTADHHAAALVAALAADADAQARRTSALAELAAAEQNAEVDRVLGEVIGSHDGKAFRSFAQSLTLDGLLAVANSHLEELAPRYQLERVPKHDLELQVIDRDLGNEIRSVQTLSGGESFLVSLALALGLSSMSAHDVRVRTLLIDEGFGTLDPATLDSALAVLDALQATGRQVGVISHVPALVERVGAHVRVSPKGGGRSEVVVAQA